MKETIKKWIEKQLKKYISICSCRIFQTACSLYEYSVKRSRALLFVVILAAFMLTMLTGLIVNIDVNWDRSQIRLMGSDATLVVEHLQKEQLESLYQSSQVETVGLLYPVKQVEDFLVCYVDPDGWEHIMFPAVSDIKGNYPQKSDEIMVSRSYLSHIGQKNCGVGDAIVVKGLGKFRIAGIFTDYAQNAGIQNLYVSKEYTQSRHKLTIQSLKAMVSSGLVNYYLAQVLEEECNIASGQITYVEHQAVGRDGTIVLFQWILLFVFLCGGLSVYHVFYTVVSADQKFYGLFAVIGMSRDHIFRCMKWQSIFVAIPGILVGEIAGAIGQSFLVPWFMAHFLAANSQTKSYLVTEVHRNPWIFLLSAVLIVGMVFAGFGVVAYRICRLSPMKCLQGRTRQRKTYGWAPRHKGNISSATVSKSKKSIRKLAWNNQHTYFGTNLLTAIRLFLSNNFFLAVWAMGRYFQSNTDYIRTDMMQKSACFVLLGNFIGCIVFGTEIISLYSVSFVQMQTRKQQFVLLQRIGMTRKQLEKMILVEGADRFVGYVVIAHILEIPVWNLLSWYLHCIGSVQMAFPWIWWIVLLFADFIVYIGTARILSNRLRNGD